MTGKGVPSGGRGRLPPVILEVLVSAIKLQGFGRVILVLMTGHYLTSYRAATARESKREERQDLHWCGGIITALPILLDGVQLGAGQ